jgi:hypothetical protein
MGRQDAEKEDLVEGIEKTAYEIARDKRVAEIAKVFAPVEVTCADL